MHMYLLLGIIRLINNIDIPTNIISGSYKRITILIMIIVKERE